MEQMNLGGRNGVPSMSSSVWDDMFEQIWEGNHTTWQIVSCDEGALGGAKFQHGVIIPRRISLRVTPVLSQIR
jgi:hypothetical protein